MSELTLSIIARLPEETLRVRSLVESFAQRERVRVTIEDYTWDTVRQALNRTAIYNQGPDISQVGSTWLRDFVEMKAIHALSPLEIRQFEPIKDFVPAAWESTQVFHDGTVWGIPWLIDARILFYRRDLLKRLGIDERGAFATPAALEETLARLQTGGVAIPWVIPTEFSWRTLHTVASWLWAYQADFLSPDGKRILFTSAPALAAFKDFFRTARYLPKEYSAGISDVQSDALFMQGKAAVTISGPWIMNMDPELLTHVGVTSPPGPAFIGGSHLMIWEHTRHLRQALNLAAYLTNMESQRRHGFQGLLPSRLSVLDIVNIPNREFSLYLGQVLQNGRAFPNFHFWALIEERLSQTLGQIWQEVLKLPDLKDEALEEVLLRHLEALAQRLDVMLGN